MISFYSKNLGYEIMVVPESRESDTLLFNITKTVFTNSNCVDVVSQRTFEKRLRFDKQGNIYTSMRGDVKWFNWITQHIYKHYSINR